MGDDGDSGETEGQGQQAPEQASAPDGDAPDGDAPDDGAPEVGTPEAGTPEPSLSDTLLHEPPVEVGAPARRWAYPKWGVALVSVFVLYHAVVLLVHNLPNKGLSRDLHKKFNDGFAFRVFGDETEDVPGHKKSGITIKAPGMRKYMQATGNTQSWAMFAPNPHRSNIFMKVLVKDSAGDIFDLKHDIHGVNRYPYLFYDRMGKINRRIIDQKGYRRHYAAWVCRDWERTHEGEAPEEIQFVKMWTRIPTPEKVFARAQGNIAHMTYDPWQLHLHQREEDTIRCATTRHAQLPDYLRERYGLPPNEKDRFRPVHIRTWHDKLESLKDAEERQGSAAVRRSGKGVSDVAAVKREGAK